MWNPPHVLIPICLEPSACIAADVPALVMWRSTPTPRVCFSIGDMVGQREYQLSLKDERKLLLSNSVYDLVKGNHFLDLTDPKLLGWYQSLPAVDRMLLQEGGGFLQFLHKHPALEVSRNIVHLKNHFLKKHHTLPAPEMSSNLDRFHGLSECVHCGTSCQSGAKKCSQCIALILNSAQNVCISEEEKSLQLLPSNVREELDLVKVKAHFCEDMPMKSSQLEDYMQSTSNNLSGPSSNLLNSFQQPEQPRRNSGSDGQLLCQMWADIVQTDGKDLKVFKDPLAQASFSLDGKLEMQRQHQSSDHDQVPLQPDTISDFPKLEEETLPEYYGFNSTTTEHTSAQWSDATKISIMATKDSTETFTADKSVVCGANNDTFPDSVSVCSNSSEWTDFTEYLSNEDDMEYETNTDEYHSVIEEDASSSTECISWIDPSWSASGQCTHVGDCIYEGCISSASLSKLNVKATTECEVSPVILNVSQAVDAGSDFRACFTFTRATEITPDLFVKFYQDVSTECDSCPVNQETQTFHRPTSEKCTITEVCMSDMDAVCQEFGKLRMVEEGLRKFKGEMASCSLSQAGGPRSEDQKSCCECGAASRAIRAELRLLALQFTMCQQHCWRRFYTSPQIETSLHGGEALPDAMSQTLMTLENSYLKMKRRILDGVPLDSLKPLSVDTEKLPAATCYRPSLIYEAFLDGDVSDNDFKASILEDEGKATQVEVLNMNTTDKENFNKNTAALQPASVLIESCVQLFPAANKAGSAGEGPSTHSSNNFHASRPLRCSLDRLTNICATPTASGTCVPEHYGTMGSFEKIMARLTEHHPNISREQIVNVLLELQGKQLELLSGLPLGDIVDMTSKLLTPPSTE